MNHQVTFNVVTGPTVTPQELQQWLIQAMVTGMQSLPSIGNVSVPQVVSEEEPVRETDEQYIQRMNLHPSVVEKLTINGVFRKPHPSEWAEDFGLGYVNRLAWEREQGDYTNQ